MGLGDLMSSVFGSKNQTNVTAPTINQNSYDYGGSSTGAADRQKQLGDMGAAGASTAGQQPFQNAQAQALGMTAQQAQGNDFGAVQSQMNQGLAQSQAASAAQAASSRGGGANLAAAQNQAANTQAAQGAAVANQGIQTKAAMQNQGIQNLSQEAGAGLGQQMQQNQFNANLDQQYQGMSNQIGAEQMQGQEAYEAQNSANQLGAAQINAQAAGQNASQNNSNGMSVLGMGASAAGAASSALSDATAKTAIAPEGGAFTLGSAAPVVVVGTQPSTASSKIPTSIPTIGDYGSIPQGTDAGGYNITGADGQTHSASAFSPGVSAVKGGASMPSTDAMNKANQQVANVLGSASPGGKSSGPQSNVQDGMAIGNDVGKSIGNIGNALASLSDYNAKTSIAGEGMLANEDAHMANFSNEAKGIQVWQNVSNNPDFYSPAHQAAEANLNKYFFTSDGNAKTATKPEGKVSAADLKALADLKGAEDSHTGNFGWMNQTAPAVQDDQDRFADVISGGKSDPFAHLQRAPETPTNGTIPAYVAQPEAVRPGGTTNVDKQMDVQHPVSFNYKDPKENGGARRHGVIAQDVAKGPAGPDIVKETPKGLVLSIPSAVSSTMAQTGRLNERQKATEEKVAMLLGQDQPAWSPTDVPSLAPRQSGIVSVYDGITPASNYRPSASDGLTSDAHAKKEVRDEGFVAGAKMGAQQAASALGAQPPQATNLAAPGYTTPVVMNDRQRTAVLKATDFARQHPEITSAMIQQHIDDAMKSNAGAPTLPAAVVDPHAIPEDAPYSFAGGQSGQVVSQRLPRGYAPQRYEVERAGPLEGGGSSPVQYEDAVDPNDRRLDPDVAGLQLPRSIVRGVFNRQASR